MPTKFLLSFLLLAFYSCAQNNPDLSTKEIKNQYVVITGTILDKKTNVPNIVFFDAIELKLKPVDSAERSLSQKKYSIKFRCIKPTHLMVFFKDVWVNPGDSINIDYSVLNENPFKDTLLISGKNIGGCVIYPYTTPPLARTIKGYPDEYNTKFKINSTLYKEQSNVFFHSLKEKVNGELKKYAVADELKNTVNKEINLWKLSKYIMYCTAINKPLDFNVKDSFNLGDFNSRWYNIGLKAAQDNYAETQTINKSSVEYYQKLFDFATQFKNPEKDFLYYNVIKYLPRINTKINQQKISEINFKMTNDIDDSLIKANVLGLMGRMDTANLASIKVRDGNNTEFTLSSIISNNKGRMIYMDFWASWCMPCRGEFPKSRNLISKFPEVKYIFISIDEDNSKWQKAVKIENLQTENCFIVDKNNFEKISKEFGFTAIPHYVLFGKKGELLIKDAPRPSDSYIENVLKNSLTEQ